ncbi:hypothetical protein Droror1_Dr00001722 [Drosera rotundifolia]
MKPAHLQEGQKPQAAMEDLQPPMSKTTARSSRKPAVTVFFSWTNYVTFTREHNQPQMEKSTRRSHAKDMHQPPHQDQKQNPNINSHPSSSPSSPISPAASTPLTFPTSSTSPPPPASGPTPTTPTTSSSPSSTLASGLSTEASQTPSDTAWELDGNGGGLCDSGCGGGVVEGKGMRLVAANRGAAAVKKAAGCVGERKQKGDMS